MIRTGSGAMGRTGGPRQDAGDQEGFPGEERSQPKRGG